MGFCYHSIINFYTTVLYCIHFLWHFYLTEVVLTILEPVLTELKITLKENDMRAGLSRVFTGRFLKIAHKIASQKNSDRPRDRCFFHSNQATNPE